MSSTEEALCYLGIISYYISKTKKNRRSRKVWIKKWLTKRERLSHVNLVRELHEEKEDFHNYFRMPEPVYEEILRLVTPIISKQDTCMREAISPHERLSATLRFLITGGTYKDLMYSSAISRQLLGYIIPETCDAIYSALKTYLKFPTSEEEWIAIAEEFESRWQFPNCLGAVDGKHVAIVPPAGAGSLYFNYKEYHSIVLMGIANANYEFIYVDIGTNGRISDGGVLQKTKFFQKLNSKRLNLPSPRKPSGHSEELPYVFIGDEAFTLRTDFMKPYPQRQSQASSSKRIYNYRVCRASRIIENVFRIYKFGKQFMGISSEITHFEK